MSDEQLKVGDPVVIRGQVVQIDGGGNAYLIRTEDECETWMFARACEPAEAIPTPTPPPNTVPVRIAVAVDREGEWAAKGGKGYDDAWLSSDMAETVTGGEGFCRITFITAHVPLPEQPAEVAGKVTNPPSSRTTAEDSEQPGDQ